MLEKFFNKITEKYEVTFEIEKETKTLVLRGKDRFKVQELISGFIWRFGYLMDIQYLEVRKE